MLFSSFLLVSNSFLAALAGAGVVLGALTTNRETVAVTDAAIATDVHQSLDVHLHLAAQVTFHFVFVTDDFTNGCCLGIGPILHAGILVHTGLLEDCSG